MIFDTKTITDMNLTCKACFIGLLFQVLLHGQEVGLLRMDPEHRATKNHAAAWGGIEEGRFKPTHAAVFQWTAGAEAQTVRHGQTTSWTGALSLRQTTGNNMLSSMFLDPGYFPIDLLEFSEGNKSRQDFRLEGGFLTDYGYEWAAGVRGALEGAHAAKRQDLQLSNLGIRLEVEPTLTYVMDDDMGFVTTYTLALRTESLSAGNPGAVFLDKGLRYGSFLDWSGANAFSVQEFTHGFTGHFHSEELAAQLKWLWKRGKAEGADFGNFAFPGSTVSAFIEQTFLADAVDHHYRLSYKRMRDQLREADSEGGITADSDRVDRELELKYEARFLQGAFRTVGVALNARRWVERSSVSPYSDLTKRNLGTATLFASFSAGGIDLDVHALAGSGLWRDRGRSLNETEDQPYRQTVDWLRQMEYLMAPQVGMGGSLKAPIPSVSGLYVQLDADWVHALKKTYLGGTNREIVTLKVGYDF
jgi:hypothetical protein